MNRLRFRYLLIYLLTFFRRNFRIFRNIKLILVFIFVSILAGALIFFLQNNVLNKTHLIEGLIGTYRQEDLPETVTNLLSSKLISVDKTDTPTPLLAKSWQISEDGKTYTFKLRDDIFWVNGEKIKASEIDVFIPDVSIEALDDNTLQFKLAEAFSPFPTLLNKPIFKKNSNYLGTGPYKVSKIQKEQIFVKRLILDSKDPALPEVIIRFYPSERIAKNALKLGEVQAVLGINEVGDLAQQKNLKPLAKTNFNQLVAVFYNTKDPILADENLRLTLSYAAPSILNETEAKTPLSPNSWAFNLDVKDYLNNPTQAKASLKKVENLEKLKKESTITLTSTSSLSHVGQELVNAWNTLGINSVLRVESGVPQNFQALLIAQNIPSDPDQYSLWHSTQAQTNLTQFSNPRVDKNLEDARKEKDLNKRKEKYQDFQKTLLDHAPATPLYFPKYNMVYMKKIEPEFLKVSSLQLPKL